ncbi:MAG: hypothetical protein AAF697_11890 [Pseudomonadota bacterium]
MPQDPAPPISAPDGWVFPYEILWPGYRNEKVTLAKLAENAEEYSIINSTISFFDPAAPSIEINEVEQLVEMLDIAYVRRADFVENVWLISCFYLAPIHAIILGHDRASVGDLLSDIAKSASELDDLLAKLPPKVDAALFYLRPADPNVLVADGPPFSQSNNELHDLALVAKRMADDIARGDGRPSELVRDTSIELLLNELHDAGAYDLRISDGNKSCGPHLAGLSGEFLTALLRHLAPDLTEEYWVPKIKPIRTKVNRAKSASGARRKT